ncbi:phytoene desaturase family protein [Microlunatus parietis]|uniref:Pyridine nucleotide-disulfide oxidoreductase domain-containing protein 2 n=1 Tax=Microlunatus parietis TaxID=682979 RepID=A0A7Y9IA65_9ACTN|nr:NAD(P)/FAD-dependent oxidoreductase [Microlunatus parietis]NYE73100.1 phytoene dehydrogenase-like protein [Microlunatus parietis]
MTSQSFDAVVIGSGHNALITAAYLARAGWSVVILERNDRPGGLVRTDELTLPGFQHDTYATAHPLLVAGPAYAELGAELAEHGLDYRNTRYPTGISLPTGESAVLSTDPDQNLAEADRLAPGDGAALAQLLEEFEPLAGPIFGLFGADLTSRASTKIIESLLYDDRGGHSEFAQLFTRTARDLLEQRFRSPVLRGLLAPWVVHLGRGPDDANSALWAVLVLLALTGAGMPIPAGGSERLIDALVALIRRHGGVVECDRQVDLILVRHGRAVGVVTADGDVVRAGRAVVASVNPDQLYLNLLAHEPAVVPARIRRQAAAYRYGRGCVQVHLALSEPPRFADDRLALVGQPHLGGGLDATSRAINEATRGLLPAEPTISFDTPSTLDPSRCPPGKAVARLQLLEVPCVLRGDAAGLIPVGPDGWTYAVKQAFADRVIELAGRHAPNLPGAVLDRYVLGPDDLARFNPNCGPGDPYGGSHDLSQSYTFRPLPGQPSHRSTVPNVYLVGAATWPGHGVNGGSGHIVARQLLNHDQTREP